MKFYVDKILNGDRQQVLRFRRTDFSSWMKCVKSLLLVPDEQKECFFTSFFFFKTNFMELILKVYENLQSRLSATVMNVSWSSFS